MPILVEDQFGAHDNTVLTITLAGAHPTPEDSEALVIANENHRRNYCTGEGCCEYSRWTDWPVSRTISYHEAYVNTVVELGVNVVDIGIRLSSNIGNNPLANWQAYMDATVQFDNTLIKAAFVKIVADVVGEFGLENATWAVAELATKFAAYEATLGFDRPGNRRRGRSGIGDNDYRSWHSHTAGAAYDAFLAPLVKQGATEFFIQNVLPPVPSTPPISVNLRSTSAIGGTLVGGDGNDTLIGGPGVDTLIGSAGSDLT